MNYIIYYRFDKTIYNIKLYKEIVNPYYADVLNNENKIIYQHYHIDKIIPNKMITPIK